MFEYGILRVLFWGVRVMVGEFTSYAIQIEWHGPFSFFNAPTYARDNGIQEGLYVVSGRHKPIILGRNFKLQYVGESIELQKRLHRRQHHALCRIFPIGAEVWIGQPVSQFDNKDRNKKQKRNDIDIAEHVLAYALKPSIEYDKTNKSLKQNVVVRNRWIHSPVRKMPSWVIWMVGTKRRLVVPQLIAFDPRSRVITNYWSSMAKPKIERFRFRLRKEGIKARIFRRLDRSFSQLKKVRALWNNRIKPTYMRLRFGFIEYKKYWAKHPGW